MSKKGSYGVDAPLVPIGFFAVSLLTVPGVIFILHSNSWSYLLLGFGLSAFIQALIYMNTTLWGKFRIWEDIFDQLSISPDAKILDLGCGRGAVLLMAAKRLNEHGKAIGVDLWRSIDQSGNNINGTKQNAKAEQVIDKIELKTADITDLPFGNNSFDYVTSNLAIHNITGFGKRRKALTEAHRVLKNNGILVIADMSKTKQYVPILRSIGMKNVEIKDAGWQGWWAGPWYPTKIITAKKNNKLIEFKSDYL